MSKLTLDEVTRYYSEVTRQDVVIWIYCIGKGVTLC